MATATPRAIGEFRATAATKTLCKRSIYDMGLTLDLRADSKVKRVLRSADLVFHILLTPS